MFLRILLENFLSFDSAQQLDLFANNKRTSLSSHIYDVRQENTSAPVLKQTAIYGANGSGKSNLVKAFSFAQSFALKRDFLNKENIGHYFFRLREAIPEKPLSLTLEFQTEKGNTYIYAFEINNSGVVTETLNESKLGASKAEIIFERGKDSINFRNSPSKEVSGIILRQIEKYPFSSILSLNNEIRFTSDESISDAYNWFEKGLSIVPVYDFIALTDIYRKYPNLVDFASKLLNKFDFGIDSIEIESEDFDDWIKKHESEAYVADQVKRNKTGVFNKIEGVRNTLSLTIENDIRKVNRLIFNQLGKNGFNGRMDTIDQSDGTIRFMMLLPSIYKAINENHTSIIDEIDNSIHPHLIRALIRYFAKTETKGQIIFTTHQTCLLNQRFMRPDEVWFTEKKEGETSLYSLNDFKVHNTINIEDGYMQGRFGAIPFIGDIDILKANG